MPRRATAETPSGAADVVELDTVNVKPVLLEPWRAHDAGLASPPLTKAVPVPVKAIEPD
jgi:hypothetical protein